MRGYLTDYGREILDGHIAFTEFDSEESPQDRRMMPVKPIYIDPEVYEYSGVNEAWMRGVRSSVSKRREARGREHRGK